MRSGEEDELDVTVLVPAHNAARFIGEALESALHQELKPRAVIVVDDGSTDGTSDLVASQFPEVTLMRTPKRGPSAARNAALQAAETPWVAFLDADDVWHPGKLRLQAEVLASQPEIRIAATTWTRHAPLRALPRARTRIVTWRDIARANAFQTSTAVLRRDLALSVGGFRPEYDGAEDWDFWLRAAMISNVLLLELPLVQYRDVPTGVSKDVWRVYERGVAMLRDWQARHGRLSPHEFRRLLTWQDIRFAYNLWREGDRARAQHIVGQACARSYALVTWVAATEFLPYLSSRALRRLRS